MITGKNNDIDIDDSLDKYGEVEIRVDDSYASGYDYITRDMAIDIIKHLKSVFDIE